MLHSLRLLQMYSNPYNDLTDIDELYSYSIEIIFWKITNFLILQQQFLLFSNKKHYIGTEIFIFS